MHFAKQCRSDSIEGGFIGHAKTIDEDRLDAHPFQHSRDLDASSVHDNNPVGCSRTNRSDCFYRILEKDSTDFHDRHHECSPAAGSHPNIRLRFCTACPAAPFTRLSSTETMTVLGPF